MSPKLPALYGAATLLLNSAIWIFGGNGNSSTNGIISVDVSKSWSTSSPLITSFPSNADTPGEFSPRSFSSMSLGADGSSLWIYGGRDDDTTDANLFGVFDTKAKAWSEAQRQKLLNNANLSAVYAQSAVRDSKGVVYYFGGVNDPWNSDLTTFDQGPGLTILNTGASTMSPMNQTSMSPGALAWHTATLVNDTLMYVIGGLKPTPSDDFNVTVYNTATGKWNLPMNFTVLPPRRHGHTAVLSADSSQIIVFGGVTNPSTYLNDVWTLDLATNQWMHRDTTGGAPSGMAYHSSILVKNQMIVMFGLSKSVSNAVYVLDTTTWTWTTSFNPNPPQTTSGSNNDTDSTTLNSNIQKIPISVAGIAGIVLASVAVASIVMLSCVQPKNRVKPI